MYDKRWWGLALLCLAACSSGEADDSAGEAECAVTEWQYENYAAPLPPSDCTEMWGCAGATVAFQLDVSQCYSGAQVSYDAEGSVLGVRQWSDEAEERDCSVRGDVACEEPERFVAPACVSYDDEAVLDACEEQDDLQHGWFGTTLTEALAATEQRCLATAMCKVDERDYRVVASLEPRECVDDPARRYDVFDALTGELVSSAYDPVEDVGLDHPRPCGQLQVGWSGPALPDCLRTAFTASEVCDFTIGVPSALAALE